MGKRFSRYKFAAKVAKGTGAAGSPLDEYVKYASGAKSVSYTREDSSNPGGDVLLYLLPFGIALGTGELLQVSMSERTNTKTLAALANAETVFNHKTKPAAEKIKVNSSYTPPKAIITIKSGAVSKPESKITGVEYQKYANSESWTVPFGKDTTETIGQVMTTIKQSVEAKDTADGNTTIRGVSFTPEKVKV